MKTGNKSFNEKVADKTGYEKLGEGNLLTCLREIKESKGFPICGNPDCKMCPKDEFLASPKSKTGNKVMPTGKKIEK